MVIGGGVIGVELASVYNAFGSEVTILCSPRRSHILPGLDEDLTIRLERQLKGKGVTVLPKADVTAFEHSDDGVVLSGKTGEKDFSIVCDKVLLASGRSPSIDGLGLENAGIENERGRILVNDKMETNVEGVYAIGDCLGKVMLAHTASAQGEVAAENAMGGDVAYDGTSCPSCVYTDPELETLTDREREVLVEIAHGLSNQEIADKLFISLPTVKTHVAHILQKINARDRVQAVVFAYENHLVQ